MNLLERVLTLLGANLNSVVEKSDDPEKALRQLQLDMRNQLVQVKTEVAKAIAEGHVLKKRSTAKQAEADAWLKKAELAVQQGHDNNARIALAQYNDVNRMLQRYQQQQKEQEHMITTMRSVLHKLESKITEVETTIELLATQKRNALIQQRVYEALNKVNTTQEPGSSSSKARDIVLDAEARARALADLQQRDLDQQLEATSTEQSIEQQLNTIKARHCATPNMHTQTGPLTNPYPPQSKTTRSSRKQAETPLTQLVEETSTNRDLDLAYLKKLLEEPQNSD